MNPNYYFDMAVEADSDELCQLLQDTPMGGNISVCMERKPNYFFGLKVHSVNPEVYVLKNANGKIISVLGIAPRDVYLDGDIKTVSFLSDLRVHPDYRNGKVLKRIIEYVKRNELLYNRISHCIIVKDNNEVLKLLNRDLSDGTKIPKFIQAGEYSSPAVYLKSKKQIIRNNFIIRKAKINDVDIMQSFLESESPKKNFVPSYNLKDLADSSYYRGLSIDSFYLAFYGEELIGITGVWDQNKFKQNRVVAYNGWINFFKPIYNIISKLINNPRLPEEGEVPLSFFLHTIFCKNNDPCIFEALVRAIYNDYCKSKYLYFMAGFDKRDPLLSILLKYSHQAFGGKHFLVSESNYPKINLDKLFYLEAARI